MQKSRQTIFSYMAEISHALRDVQDDVDQVVRVLRDSVKDGLTLWVLGNGGSLAIAQHFAQDLIKLNGIKAQAITCPSILTAYTNDEQFENCYSMPLGILREKSDPVVIFSCSGSSRNYKNVIDVCGANPVIAIVGTDGGFLKERSHYYIHVQSDNYQVCESAFSIIADMLNYGLESES